MDKFIDVIRNVLERAFFYFECGIRPTEDEPVDDPLDDDSINDERGN